MTTAQQLVQAATDFQHERRLARQHFAPAGRGRSTGRRRDQAEAAASRKYKARKTRILGSVHAAR